ncbi:uncharacterized protein VTP21DRAFT_5510 [Calcarisporiella thermophila]|uniref:uncharacterized protein n=1 Tax=Calcarisporiella thermophila TaxID=911321 RepID=UPI003743A16B
MRLWRDVVNSTKAVAEGSSGVQQTSAVEDGRARPTELDDETVHRFRLSISLLCCPRASLAGPTARTVMSPAPDSDCHRQSRPRDRANLKKRYPTQVFTIDAEELPRSDACLNDPSLFANASRESWTHVHGLSLVENGLLAHVNTFVGNGFSTISYIVAIKHNMHRSYFLQSYTQLVLEQSLALLLPLSLLVLVLSGTLLFRRFMRRLRKGFDARNSLYLPTPSGFSSG